MENRCGVASKRDPDKRLIIAPNNSSQILFLIFLPPRRRTVRKGTIYSAQAASHTESGRFGIFGTFVCTYVKRRAFKKMEEKPFARWEIFSLVRKASGVKEEWKLRTDIFTIDWRHIVPSLSPVPRFPKQHGLMGWKFANRCRAGFVTELSCALNCDNFTWNYR